jgi:hypothetical protein
MLNHLVVQTVAERTGKFSSNNPLHLFLLQDLPLGLLQAIATDLVAGPFN